MMSGNRLERGLSSGWVRALSVRVDRLVVESAVSRHDAGHVARNQSVTDGLVVTTTGMHLATRIGHALAAAYKGHTEYQYSDSEAHVRVNWLRN